MSNGVLTLDQIKQNFNQYISTQNANINPYVKGTDWDVFGTALSGIISGVYQDQQNISNATFIQFATGLFLDYWAYSLGQPPRSGATYTTVIATIAATPLGLEIFPVGTVFSTTYNNQNYNLIGSVTTSETEPVTISLQCQTTGSGLSLPTGAVLTNTVYSNTDAVVASSTDGQSAETDSQLRQRLQYIMQNPQGGGRTGQYISWAEASDSNVTGGIEVFPLTGSDLTIGVFVLAGGEDYDYLLVNETPYNRTATPATVLNSNVYINALRPIDSDVYVASVSLFQPGEYMSPNVYQITVQVSLITGLTLSSLITNIDGSQITVENMILQELRRGFITYPFQGTLIDTTNYILISRLEQVLDSSLSVNGGIYQQILTDRNITILNTTTSTPETTGIPVTLSTPNSPLDSDGNLICLYDLITYDNTGAVVAVSGLPTPIVTLV